jgi:hypothetical protein
MQPYKQTISCDRYSQTNQRSDLTDAALLALKNSPRSTLLLHLRGGVNQKSKGTDLIDR